MVLIAFVVLVLMNAIVYDELVQISNATIFDDISYGHPFYRIFHFVTGMVFCDLFMLLKNKYSSIRINTKMEVLTIIVVDSVSRVMYFPLTGIKNND